MTDTRTFAKITVTETDGVAFLNLASDKVNALDVATLGEISSYLDQSEQGSAVRALVVTGQGAIFSAGLNVSEVVDNDIGRTGVLLDSLTDALVRLFRFAKPTVAAINGPAIAGGCILACACDKRLIADGARIGATELKVGVPFPVVAVELLRHACGAGAEQVMLDAALYDADEACRTGLAHRVVPGASCRPRRSPWPRSSAGLDAPAYALTKAASRRVALSVVDDPDAAGSSTAGYWPTGRTTGRGRASSGCASRRVEAAPPGRAGGVRRPSPAHRTVRKNSHRSSANRAGCSMAAKWPPRGMVTHRVTLYCSSTHDRGQRRTSFGYLATPVGTATKGSARSARRSGSSPSRAWPTTSPNGSSSRASRW